MAIKIKSTNALSAMQKAGVATKYTDWVSAHAVVSLTATMLKMSVHPHCVWVPVSLGFLHDLTVGHADPKEVAVFAAAVYDAVGKLMIAVDNQELAEGLTETSTVPSETATLPSNPVTVTSVPPAIELTVVEPPFAPLPVKKANATTPIKLRDAKNLYQPVLGTSGGSRYALIAGRDDLKVAARLKGDSLSLRVEGDGLPKYKSKISAAGLECKTDYASVHVSVDGADLMQKTLGALLFSLGVPFESPYPDVKIMKELKYV